MPQRKQLVNRFRQIKGVNTESSLLEFPADSSVDESNFELKRNGERHRRKGLDYETDHEKVPATTVTAGPDELIRDGVVNTYQWNNVGGDVTLVFLVIQIGHYIKFHDIGNTDGSLSSRVKDFEIDLRDYPDLGAVGVPKEFNAQFAHGLGKLFIANNSASPVIVTYDPLLDDITVEENIMEVRDFQSLPDLGSEVVDIDERPVVLSKQHEYNLNNRGWPLSTLCLNEADGSTAATLASSISKTFSEMGFYPSLSDNFSRARAREVVLPENINAYSPFDLEKYADTESETSAPLGARKIQALTRVRILGGVVVPFTDPLDHAPPASVAFFAGRVFYGIEGGFYFSQLATLPEQLQRFYQEANPTNPDDNLLVPTDGGFQPIPECGELVQLLPAGKNLFAFSAQGIWIISGISSDFSATSISVSRLTDLPVRSARSTIIVEDNIYFVSDSGIFRFSTATLAQGQTPRLENITEGKIHTKFVSISATAAHDMLGVYDKANRRVQWMYTTTPSVLNRSASDEFIFYDLVLDAFTFYSIKPTVDQAKSGVLSFDAPRVYAAFPLPGLLTALVTRDVIDASGVPVIDTGGSPVIAQVNAPRPGLSKITYLIGLRENELVEGETYYTFADFTDPDFEEWTTHNTEDSLATVDASAYMIAGYTLQDNAINFTNQGYLLTFCNRTETAYIDDGMGNPVFDFPSGLKVKQFWDWDVPTPDGGATGTDFYDLKPETPPTTPVIGNTFDNNKPVTEGRHKLQDRGKALSYIFQSEAGKDCQILGWAFELLTNNNT